MIVLSFAILNALCRSWGKYTCAPAHYWLFYLQKFLCRWKLSECVDTIVFINKINYWKQTVLHSGRIDIFKSKLFRSEGRFPIPRVTITIWSCDPMCQIRKISSLFGTFGISWLIQTFLIVILKGLLEWCNYSIRCYDFNV